MSKKAGSRAKAALSTLPQPTEAADAFAKVKAEIDALSTEEIRPVTVEIPFAVTIALGAVPRVSALRAEIVKKAPATPIAQIDGLETYAFAAYYAHLMSLPTPKTESETAKLVEAGRPLREDLLIAAEALAHRGLLDADLIAKIRSGSGHVDLAGDLIALGALFTATWNAVESKTAVSLEEVQRAAQLGTTLLVSLSRDALPSVNELTAAEVRARAFTLLLRSYDECRRAVHYLRFHEGDAHDITPSLFTRRARAARAVVEEEPAEEAQAEPLPEPVTSF